MWSGEIVRAIPTARFNSKRKEWPEHAHPEHIAAPRSGTQPPKSTKKEQRPGMVVSAWGKGCYMNNLSIAQTRKVNKYIIIVIYW